jgi:hypothetical protein
MALPVTPLICIETARRALGGAGFFSGPQHVSLSAVVSSRVASRPTSQTAAPVEAIALAIAPPIAELAPDITAFSSGPMPNPAESALVLGNNR